MDAFPVYEKPIPTIDETAAYQVYLDFGATQQAEYATSESAMNVHMATLEFEGWLSLGFVPTIEPLDMAETRVAEAPEESQKYLWIAATSEAEMIDAVATYYYLMTPTPPSASFVKEDDQVSTDIGGSTKSSTLVGCPTGGCVEYPVLCEHVIKGNIAFESREKIYHLPGQAFYEATVISPEFGERWFCTEDEARAAGWRKSFE